MLPINSCKTFAAVLQSRKNQNLLMLNTVDNIKTDGNDKTIDDQT